MKGYTYTWMSFQGRNKIIQVISPFRHLPTAAVHYEFH